MEGTSYENVICIDDSDDDKVCCSQSSAVGNGAVQDWQLGVANLVEAQTKEYFANMLQEMHANNSIADDNMMDAKSDDGDNKIPAKR
eukprot:3010934-Ditylum_brightwellii.AAC.1